MRAAQIIVDEIGGGGCFGVFASRPPAEHLVLGVCDLPPALEFVVASTHGHPCDTGPIAVLDVERLQVLHDQVGHWLAARRPRRYDVQPAGRAEHRALLIDVRTQRVLLRVGGPDRFRVAARLAAVLNTSPTETPAP